MSMRFFVAVFLILASVVSCAQDKGAPSPEKKSATVPAMIDHNRVVINAELTLKDGSSQTVRAWVDNGDADLNMSRHVATLLDLPVTCDDHECSSPPPSQISIGGMTIPLSDIKQSKIPLKPVNASSVLASGMNVDINVPASVLRHYDVLIDFPGRKFSIAAPGGIHFQGASGKVLVNAQNGLIQVPSKIENKKYNIALDLGSSISFLSDEVFGKLASAGDVPLMTGAVGSANMWGADEETKWKVMRVNRVQYGPLFLTDVAMVELPKSTVEFFEKRVGVPTVGLIGGNVFLNYRVGLDYAHSMVYFDIGRMFNFPDFDVVGLILRPEDDGRYFILGIADFEGKPSVPSGADGIQAGDYLVAVDGIPVRGSTMGQVWAMLGGTPGKDRRITIERAGKQATVLATVQHFLGAVPDSPEKKRRNSQS